MTQEKFVYKASGPFNQELLRETVSGLEAECLRVGVKPIKAKKVIAIVIECVQNLVLYSFPPTHPDQRANLGIWLEGEDVVIQTSNAVSPEKVAFLTHYLEEINLMDEGTLRERYKAIMANGEFGASGGAGLGFLNIARKCKNSRLSFAFLPLSSGNVQFQFSVRV